MNLKIRNTRNAFSERTSKSQKLMPSLSRTAPDFSVMEKVLMPCKVSTVGKGKDHITDTRNILQ